MSSATPWSARSRSLRSPTRLHSTSAGSHRALTTSATGEICVARNLFILIKDLYIISYHQKPIYIFFCYCYSILNIGLDLYIIHITRSLSPLLYIFTLFLFCCSIRNIHHDFFHEQFLHVTTYNCQNVEYQLIKDSL